MAQGRANPFTYQQNLPEQKNTSISEFLPTQVFQPIVGEFVGQPDVSPLIDDLNKRFEDIDQESAAFAAMYDQSKRLAQDNPLVNKYIEDNYTLDPTITEDPFAVNKVKAQAAKFKSELTNPNSLLGRAALNYQAEQDMIKKVNEMVGVGEGKIDASGAKKIINYHKNKYKGMSYDPVFQSWTPYPDFNTPAGRVDAVKMVNDITDKWAADQTGWANAKISRSPNGEYYIIDETSGTKKFINYNEVQEHVQNVIMQDQGFKDYYTQRGFLKTVDANGRFIGKPALVAQLKGRDDIAELEAEYGDLNNLPPEQLVQLTQNLEYADAVTDFTAFGADKTAFKQVTAKRDKSIKMSQQFGIGMRKRMEDAQASLITSGATINMADAEFRKSISDPKILNQSITQGRQKYEELQQFYEQQKAAGATGVQLGQIQSAMDMHKAKLDQQVALQKGMESYVNQKVDNNVKMFSEKLGLDLNDINDRNTIITEAKNAGVDLNKVNLPASDTRGLVKAIAIKKGLDPNKVDKMYEEQSKANKNRQEYTKMHGKDLQITPQVIGLGSKQLQKTLEDKYNEGNAAWVVMNASGDVIMKDKNKPGDIKITGITIDPLGGGDRYLEASDKDGNKFWLKPSGDNNISDLIGYNLIENAQMGTNLVEGAGDLATKEGARQTNQQRSIGESMLIDRWSKEFSNLGDNESRQIIKNGKTYGYVEKKNTGFGSSYQVYMRNPKTGNKELMLDTDNLMEVGRFIYPITQ